MSEKLVQRIKELEAELLKLQARRRAKRLGRSPHRKGPNGLVAEPSYGDRVLSPDEDEFEEREIDEVLKKE